MYDALVGLTARAGVVRITRDARAIPTYTVVGATIEMAGRDPIPAVKLPSSIKSPGGEPANRNVRRYPRLCPANRRDREPAPSGSGAPQGISISRQRLVNNNR